MLGNGHYMLGPLLGRGSFGITYRGLDQRLNRDVAIKEYFPEGSVRHAGTIVPPASLGRDGYETERRHFIEEAQVLARFKRSGIVTVYEVFEENDTAYMVMEHIAGRTLVEVLKQRGRPLPPADAVRYVLAVADALATVHDQHLLHRDVKPGNIMVTTEDRAVLIDFGAARHFELNQHTSMMTAIGTPGYAPLEQWGTSGRFGPTSDVYSLAATLYHLLTGQMPPSAADRATNETLVPPHELDRAIPASLSGAIVCALSVRKDDRPQTMAAFAASLRDARSNAARPPASAPAAPTQSQPHASRQPAVAEANRRRVSAPQAGNHQRAPSHASAAAGGGTVVPPLPGRRFPWQRRRRDRIVWAVGFVLVPAVLVASVFSLSVAVPLFVLCAFLPSWRLRRLSRRALRRSLRLGINGVRLCAVSSVTLAIVAASTARSIALGAAGALRS